MSFRAFLGVPVDPDCTCKLAQAAGIMQQFDKKREIRWVPEENYHLTVAFLGEIGEERVTPLMSAVEAAVATLRCFPVHFTGAGFFPANARPRLVLARAEMSAELGQLHANISRVLRQLRMRFDKKTYMPHVTLGRVRGRGSPKMELIPQDLNCAFTLSEVHLYRSDLDARGARYRIIQTARLSDAS